MQKMTIAQKFDDVVNFITGEGQVTLSQDEIVEFLLDRKDKAIKKAGNRKPTSTQKANEGIKAIILDNLTTAGQTVTELQDSTPDLAVYSNQKLSAILRQMVLDGSVTKTIDKKKSYFSLA
jgi:hypothetical protein